MSKTQCELGLGCVLLVNKEWRQAAIFMLLNEIRLLYTQAHIHYIYVYLVYVRVYVLMHYTCSVEYQRKCFSKLFNIFRFV